MVVCATLLVKAVVTYLFCGKPDEEKNFFRCLSDADFYCFTFFGIREKRRNLPSASFNKCLRGNIWCTLPYYSEMVILCYRHQYIIHHC